MESQPQILNSGIILKTYTRALFYGCVPAGKGYI